MWIKSAIADLYGSTASMDCGSYIIPVESDFDTKHPILPI